MLNKLIAITIFAVLLALLLSCNQVRPYQSYQIKVDPTGPRALDYDYGYDRAINNDYDYGYDNGYDLPAYDDRAWIR